MQIFPGSEEMTGDKHWIVVTVFGMAAMAMSLLQPVMPLYLTSIDISPELIGLMISTSMVAMAIGEGYWGWVADRIGARIPLIMGTVVCGLFALSFILADSVFYLFTIFFFWGLFRSAIFGPSRGILAAGAPVGKKAARLAIVTAILAASQTLGAFPSGFIADAWGYASVFAISASISFLGAVMVYFGFKKNGSLEKGSRQKEKLKLNSRLKPLSVQCLVTVFHFLALGIVIAFLPLLIIERMDHSVAIVGILISVRGIAVLLFSVPMGKLADRLGNKVMMIFGLMVTAAAMAGFSFAASLPWFLAIVILHGLGHTLFSPAALSLFSDSAPADRQGSAMGFYGAICENTGIVAGSGLGGFLWSALGSQGTFWVGTGASLCGLFVFLFFLKRFSACISGNFDPLS